MEGMRYEKEEDEYYIFYTDAVQHDFYNALNCYEELLNESR